MINSNSPAKMSYTSYGTTTTVEFPTSDIGLEELFNAFKTVMVGATFSESQIIDFVIEMGEHYSEYKRDRDE
jgi:hypothetical protein